MFEVETDEDDDHGTIVLSSSSSSAQSTRSSSPSPELVDLASTDDEATADEFVSTISETAMNASKLGTTPVAKDRILFRYTPPISRRLRVSTLHQRELFKQAEQQQQQEEPDGTKESTPPRSVETEPPPSPSPPLASTKPAVVRRSTRKRGRPPVKRPTPVVKRNDRRVVDEDEVIVINGDSTDDDAAESVAVRRTSRKRGRPPAAVKRPPAAAVKRPTPVKRNNNRRAVDEVDEVIVINGDSTDDDYALSTIAPTPNTTPSSSIAATRARRQIKRPDFFSPEVSVVRRSERVRESSSKKKKAPTPRRGRSSTIKTRSGAKRRLIFESGDEEDDVEILATPPIERGHEYATIPLYRANQLMEVIRKWKIRRPSKGQKKKKKTTSSKSKSKPSIGRSIEKVVKKSMKKQSKKKSSNVTHADRAIADAVEAALFFDGYGDELFGDYPDDESQNDDDRDPVDAAKQWAATKGGTFAHLFAKNAYKPTSSNSIEPNHQPIIDYPEFDQPSAVDSRDFDDGAATTKEDRAAADVIATPAAIKVAEGGDEVATPKKSIDHRSPSKKLATPNTIKSEELLRRVTRSSEKQRQLDAAKPLAFKPPTSAVAPLFRVVIDAGVPCKYCTHVCGGRSTPLPLHLARHHRHRCETCVEQFSTAALLNQHRKKHNVIQRCYLCERDYASMPRYKAHLKTKTHQQFARISSKVYNEMVKCLKLDTEYDFQLLVDGQGQDDIICGLAIKDEIVRPTDPGGNVQLHKGSIIEFFHDQVEARGCDFLLNPKAEEEQQQQQDRTHLSAASTSGIGSGGGDAASNQREAFVKQWFDQQQEQQPQVTILQPPQATYSDFGIYAQPMIGGDDGYQPQGAAAVFDWTTEQYQYDDGGYYVPNMEQQQQPQFVSMDQQDGSESIVQQMDSGIAGETAYQYDMEQMAMRMTDGGLGMPLAPTPKSELGAMKASRDYVVGSLTQALFEASDDVRQQTYDTDLLDLFEEAHQQKYQPPAAIITVESPDDRMKAITDLVRSIVDLLADEDDQGAPIDTGVKDFVDEDEWNTTANDTSPIILNTGSMFTNGFDLEQVFGTPPLLTPPDTALTVEDLEALDGAFARSPVYNSMGAGFTGESSGSSFNLDRRRSSLENDFLTVSDAVLGDWNMAGFLVDDALLHGDGGETGLV